MNPLKLSAVRSPSYYFDEIIFQVEATLFRVPRNYFVENSSIFRDMFSIPEIGGSHLEGSSDEHPLKLDGIGQKDFERILKVMYPPQIPAKYDMTKDEWMSILTLAKMWYLVDIHALAVDKLTDSKMNMDPAERVILARDHYVIAWLQTGYHDFIWRDFPPSFEECEEIGWPSAILIFHLREDRFNRRIQSYQSLADTRRAFAKEYAEIDERHQEFIDAVQTP